MMRRIGGLLLCCMFLLGSLNATAAAQEAVTVTGHVSAESMPVRGATVRIEALALGATTSGEGRYSFIIPSSRVRGQTVSLTASYPRFRPKSVELTLVGGSVVQDFDLSAVNPATPPRVEQPRVTDTSPGTRSAPSTSRPSAGPGATRAGNPSVIALDTRARIPAYAPMVDSTAFMELAGPVDLPTALAGRFAGLDVLTTSTLGGSSAMLVRGPRSIAGLTQPLIVVNGLVLENSNLTNATQLAGRGGFDYGSAVNDLNVDDIAFVELLRGPLAAMRFGGRSANGVLLVTTRSARGLNGLEVSASQSFSSSSVFRLPSYQDVYGQGLRGKFAFFDGKGAGINDASDESWGPALDGLPVIQSSLTENGRPDVRAFLPQPSNVSGYFTSGRTLATNLALQSGNALGQIRASLSNRSSTGVTPNSSIGRRSALVTGSARPNARLDVSGDLQLYSGRGEDRAGTGFDESNAVSGFSHMPRQVDVATYRTRLRDAALKQLSWNYSGRNNPYWAAQENDNHDSRTRYVVGGAASFALSNWMTASVRGGTDHSSERRSFTIAPGWMGGFPYFAGRGDFSTGGFQGDEISSSQTDGELLFRATPGSRGPVALAFTGGVGRRTDDIGTNVRGADKLVDTTTPPQLRSNGSSSTSILFGGAEARVRDFAALAVSARSESSSLSSVPSVSTLYPSVVATVDLARADSARPDGGVLQILALHGGWSRSGNEGTAALLQRLGVTSSAEVTTLTQLSAPELTTGVEAGATLRMFESRVSADVSLYSDRSENLLFASSGGFARTGSLSNKGIEASVALVPLRMENGFEWSIGTTFGRNSNLVESLSSGGPAVTLAPAFGGASIVARIGSSLGVIVGNAYLRDGTGQLLLRDGRPLVDSIGGPRVLGESVPTWIGGLSSSARYRGLAVSILLDTHQGGRVFSASNRAGAYAGVLAETAFRPDTGLLLAGLDVTTGGRNTVHVSTEDYYHALGAITERWVYDASFVKLREARVSFTLPLRFIPSLQVQSLRASIIGRNLAMWTNTPNIDPEAVLSTSTFRGAEMGQLPTAKSIGFQLSLTP